MHYTNFTATLPSSSNSTYSISTLLSRRCTATYKDLIAFQTISVNIANTGSVSSDFVVLGFLTGTFGPIPYPQKSLVAYTRLHNVTAGSSQTAHLTLNLGSLARADDAGDMVLYPGDYSLVIDTDAKAVWDFTLEGDAVTLDGWHAPLPFGNLGNGTM